jgi:hypothetical protein
MKIFQKKQDDKNNGAAQDQQEERPAARVGLGKTYLNGYIREAESPSIPGQRAFISGKLLFHSLIEAVKAIHPWLIEESGRLAQRKMSAGKGARKLEPSEISEDVRAILNVKRKEFAQKVGAVFGDEGARYRISENVNPDDEGFSEGQDRVARLTALENRLDLEFQGNSLLTLLYCSIFPDVLQDGIKLLPEGEKKEAWAFKVRLEKKDCEFKEKSIQAAINEAEEILRRSESLERRREAAAMGPITDAEKKEFDELMQELKQPTKELLRERRGDM